MAWTMADRFLGSHLTFQTFGHHGDDLLDVLLFVDLTADNVGPQFQWYRRAARGFPGSG